MGVSAFNNQRKGQILVVTEFVLMKVLVIGMDVEET
jgi:hypothetical protein